MINITVGPKVIASTKPTLPSFDIFIGDSLGYTSSPNRFNHDIAIMGLHNTFMIKSSIIRNNTGFIAAIRVNAFDDYNNIGKEFNISIRSYRNLKPNLKFSPNKIEQVDEL